ncbi:hypothetical protein BC940DRAFT_288041 [Gongronella butleri]|nr:hypothetical protein BC940DRAFT_288041 [Gongronella butleri]
MDRSLDDILKDKRSRKGSSSRHGQGKAPASRPSVASRLSTSLKPQPRTQQQRPQRPSGKSGPLFTASAKAGSSVLSRLGPQGAGGARGVQKTKAIPKGGLTTAALRAKGKQQQQQSHQLSQDTTPQLSFRSSSSSARGRTAKAADPSQIVISKRLRNSDPFEQAQDLQQQQHEQRARMAFFGTSEPAFSQQHHHHQHHQPIEQQVDTSFQHFGGPPTSIRGASLPLLALRGEAGPAYVLINGLDRLCTENDLKSVCMNYGEVEEVDMHYDKHGWFSGEAQVKFATKASALQCIRIMDNQSVDGKVLQLTLRERPATDNVPQQQFQQQQHQPAPQMRSTLASSFGSGRMYTDRL